MKLETKVTEDKEDFFISEEQSMRRWGTYGYCGNYERVTRTKWVKLWFLWIPVYCSVKNINVDSLLGYYALGYTSDFNGYFPSDLQIEVGKK